MTIKAILFDKDGTLIDFADTFFDAVGDIIHKLSDGDSALAHKLAHATQFDLEKNSCPASSQIVGGTALTIAELWHPHLETNSALELSLVLDAYFDEHTAQSVRAFDFTKPTLSTLGANGVILGVATNDSGSNAINHLEAIGESAAFSFVCGYDSGFGAKPEPGPVEAFAKHANVDITQVAMVGDSINDLLAGKNAGATAIGVTSGIASVHELEPYTDHVVEDISKLPELFMV